MGQPIPDTAANATIQAYLQILEREGSDSLIAMYAACLREGNGEESYARFLRCKWTVFDSTAAKSLAINPNASKDVRMQALLRAKQHHLDVEVIAKETVRKILEEAFAVRSARLIRVQADHLQSIPSLASDQPDITSFSNGLSERDVYLIRSLEWLTLMPETADQALIKSNDVARYFLGPLLPFLHGRTL